MSPVHEEQVFDFAELHVLGLLCEKCGAEVLIDMAKRDEPPPQCACGEKIENDFWSAVRTYMTSYRHICANKAIHSKLHIRRSV